MKRYYFHRDLKYKEDTSSVSNAFFTSLAPKLHFCKVSLKGAQDNFSLIPQFFFKKVEIFIPLEVYTYA